MPALLGAAARAALVKLTCPRCGEVQARARAPKSQQLSCRKCGHKFTRAELEAQRPAKHARRKR